MEISYAPDLLEEVINMEIKRREEEGDLKLAKEYHSLREPQYELPLDEDEREEAFEEVDKKFFAKLSLDTGIKEVLEEFSMINEDVGLMEIMQAYSRDEENSNISNKHIETGQKAAIIRLRAQCFFDSASQKQVIRHECMHLKDILDDTFGYNRKRFSNNPTEETFIRDRYRAIWDIYIESRLAKEGKESVLGKDDSFKEFDAIYSKIPEAHRKAIFERLWERERMTHTEIVELAKDPYKLLQMVEAGQEGKIKNIVLPGSSCPLCKFPTYKPVQDISSAVKDAIKEDFPNWEDGWWACERCVDLYSLKTE